MLTFPLHGRFSPFFCHSVTVKTATYSYTTMPTVAAAAATAKPPRPPPPTPAASSLYAQCISLSSVVAI